MDGWLVKYLYLPQKVKSGENDNVCKISVNLKIFWEDKGKSWLFLANQNLKHTSTQFSTILLCYYSGISDTSIRVWISVVIISDTIYTTTSPSWTTAPPPPNPPPPPSTTAPPPPPSSTPHHNKSNPPLPTS